MALITFIFSVRKHYNQIFTEAFVNFIIEVDHPSDKNHMKNVVFIHSIDPNRSDAYSIKNFLIDTNQRHRKDSLHYAELYNSLQHHKIKVILRSLV